MSSTNWKQTRVFKILLITIIAFIIAMIVFGFTDLEISKAIVNENLEWAQFFRDYGEPPGHAFWFLGATVIGGIIWGKDDIKKQKMVGWFFLIVALLAFIVGIIIAEEELTIYGSILGVALLFFMIFTKNKDWNEYKTIALLVALLALINPLILVQILKTISGRIRFRDLTPPDYLEFTPWFIFNGINGNESFPSGHTAMGWMFLPLLIIVRNREWKDLVKILAYIVTFGWGILVGISRIFIGAHYASDVAFSTCTAFIITIILYKILYFDKGK